MGQVGGGEGEEGEEVGVDRETVVVAVVVAVVLANMSFKTLKNCMRLAKPNKFVRTTCLGKLPTPTFISCRTII